MRSAAPHAQQDDPGPRWEIGIHALDLERGVVAWAVSNFPRVAESEIEDLYAAIREAACGPVGAPNAYPRSGEDLDDLKRWLCGALRNDLRNLTSGRLARHRDRADGDVVDVAAGVWARNADPAEIVTARRVTDVLSEVAEEGSPLMARFVLLRDVLGLSPAEVQGQTGWTDRQYKRRAEKTRAAVNVIRERGAAIFLPVPLFFGRLGRRCWALLSGSGGAGAGGGLLAGKGAAIVCVTAAAGGCVGIGEVAGVLPSPVPGHRHHRVVVTPRATAAASAASATTRASTRSSGTSSSSSTSTTSRAEARKTSKTTKRRTTRSRSSSSAGAGLKPPGSEVTSAVQPKAQAATSPPIAVTTRSTSSTATTTTSPKPVPVRRPAGTSPDHTSGEFAPQP